VGYYYCPTSKEMFFLWLLLVYHSLRKKSIGESGEFAHGSFGHKLVGRMVVCALVVSLGETCAQFYELHRSQVARIELRL
jgi:hypothetical protein